MKIDILQDVTVSPNLDAGAIDVACAYPVTCRSGNGDLVCVYRRGKEKHSRDGVLVAQRSGDDGRTWSGPTVIYDGMHQDRPESVHAGVVVQAMDGAVLAIFTAVPAQEQDAYIFSQEGRALGQQLYIASSKDGGRSWSAPAARQLSGTPRNFYVGTRPVLLANGDLFIPVEATAEENQEISMAAISSDGGATLQPVLTCAADKTGAISYGDARCTLLPSGHIVMLLWAYVTATEETLPVHRCVSEDGGRTWSLPASTQAHSQIMTPLALSGERMIAVSTVRTPPEGIWLWFSRDAGQTWTAAPPALMWDPGEARMKATFPRLTDLGPKGEHTGIWAALPSYTFGYPDLLRLQDDVFLLTYYATINGVIHVRACRFALSGMDWRST